MSKTSFHVPTRPYTPIDSLNQRAAAMGSPRYAFGASDANYNGHRVDVYWNDHRGYYVCDYFWAGRNVLARGSFANCLSAALREFDRGALGASVAISLRDGDADALALCESSSRLVPGREPERAEWWTWRHEAAAACARDYANPGRLVMIFDWELMQAAESERAYEDALRAKYGRVFR